MSIHGKGPEYPEGAATEETIVEGLNHKIKAGRTQDSLTEQDYWIEDNDGKQIGEKFYGEKGFEEAEKKLNEIEGKDSTSKE